MRINVVPKANVRPSVQDLEQALSIRRQINALEKRLAALLGRPTRKAARVRRRRRPYEYDHHYGLTLYASRPGKAGRRKRNRGEKERPKP